MPWIEFIEDYDWWLPSSTKPFKAGAVVFATKALAKAVIAAGKAKAATRPKDAPKDVVDDNEQEAS